MYRLYPETGKQLSWNICLIIDGGCCVIIWSIQITKNTHPVPNSILISPFSRPLICKRTNARMCPLLLSPQTCVCTFIHSMYIWLCFEGLLTDWVVLMPYGLFTRGVTHWSSAFVSVPGTFWIDALYSLTDLQPAECGRWFRVSSTAPSVMASFCVKGLKVILVRFL